MNKPLYLNQKVKYVNADGEIVDGVITELVSPDHAHVKHGEKAVALALQSEGKEKNTFFVPEEAAETKSEKKPFMPGAGSPGTQPAKS